MRWIMIEILLILSLTCGYEEPVYEDMYSTYTPPPAYASSKYSEYYKPRDPYKQALYSFDGCRLTTELQICLADAALYSAHGDKFNKERFFNKAYYCALIFKTHVCRTVALREGQDPYSAPHVKIRHHTITNWNCHEAYKLVAIEQVVNFLDQISPVLKPEIKLHQVLDLLHQAVFDVLSQSATCAMKVFRDFSDEQRREYARYAVMDKELYAAADYQVDADTIGYKQEEEYANEYGYDIDDIYGEGYYNKYHDAPDPEPYDAKQPQFAYGQKSTILYPDSARYLLTSQRDPYRPVMAHRPHFMSPYSTRRRAHYETDAKSYGFLPKKNNYFLSLKNADSEGDIIEARLHDKCLGMDVCGERCSWRPIPDCCWNNTLNCNASSLTDCRIYGNHKVLDHPLQGFVKKKYMRTQAYYDPLNRYLQKEKAFSVCKKAHAYGKNDVDGLCVGVGYFIRDLDTGKRHRVKIGGIANALDDFDKKRQFNCVEFKWHPSSLDCSCSLLRIRLEMETYCCKLSQDYVHPLIQVIDLYSSSSFPFYTTDHKLDAQNCNVSTNATTVKMYKNQQILGLHVKGVVLSVEGCEQPIVAVEQVVDDVLQRSLKYYN